MTLSDHPFTSPTHVGHVGCSGGFGLSVRSWCDDVSTRLFCSACCSASVSDGIFITRSSQLFARLLSRASLSEHTIVFLLLLLLRHVFSTRRDVRSCVRLPTLCFRLKYLDAALRHITLHSDCFNLRVARSAGKSPQSSNLMFCS